MDQKSLGRYLAITLILMALFAVAWKSYTTWEKYGCWPKGGHLPAGMWLNSCKSGEVGDLSREEFWYGFSGDMIRNLKDADTIFFGDSRLLYALSKGGASEWLHQKGVKPYFLAFEGGEEDGWGLALAGRYQLHPKVVVVDADPYFTGTMQDISRAVVDDKGSGRDGALAIRSFFKQAEIYCSQFAWLCGHTLATYRRLSDGSVTWSEPDPNKSIPIPAPPPPDRSWYPKYTANAREFLSRLGVRPECVVFTLVPNNMQDESVARMLARQIGGTFIAPHFQGIVTVDTMHLSKPSAMRWTPAFLAGLEPVLKRCGVAH